MSLLDVNSDARGKLPNFSETTGKATAKVMVSFILSYLRVFSANISRNVLFPPLRENDLQSQQMLMLFADAFSMQSGQKQEELLIQLSQLISRHLSEIIAPETPHEPICIDQLAP